MEDCEGVYFIGRHKNPTNFWDGLIDEFKLYNRALSEGELLYLAGKRATPIDPSTEGLVAYYPLENDVLDGSGNGNDGTIVGNPTFVEGPAGYGMALDFDGESYVDCGNDTSLDITGPISMSIWIRPGTDGSVETAPLCKADASAGWSWQLRYGWNTAKPTIMGFQFNATGGRVWVYVNQDLPIGQWYYIAASHDGATVKCYLDGVETDSAPMTGFAGGPSSLLIGSDGWRNDWIGAIDEVAIYNRDLSGGEIRYLAGFRAPVDPGTGDLIAYYAFENNTEDGSGNGLHGTVVGDPTYVEGLAGYGMAMDFDGADDLVELGKFDVVGGITLAAWIKADDFEINDARVISKAKEWGGDDHWWMLSTISETSLRFRLKTDEGPGTATLISDPVLEAGVWAHVVAAWDGSMMRIYKDGVEVASQEKGGSAVAVDPAISVAIGSQPSDAFASDPSHVAKFFDGLIDEVRIYNRALSELEVRYLAGDR